MLAATTGAQLAGVMGTAIFPVIAPKLAEEMGIEPVLIGYQMSLVYGAAMFGSLLLNAQIGRLGACRTTQIGLGMCVLGMGLALTSNPWAIVATSVLLGVATSLMVPASVHLLFRYCPPRNRNFVFSLKQTGVPLGWTLVALFAPAITLMLGWRWAVALIALLAMVVLVAMQPVRARWDDDRHAAREVPPRVFEGLAAAWQSAPLRWLSAASWCLSFVQLCLSTFLVTMLVDEAGYTLIAAGLVLSCSQAAGVGGRVLWGWVGDRTGDSLSLLAAIAAISTACCIATTFVTAAWPAAAVTALFGVFGATAVGWNGLFMAEVARMSPRDRVSVVTGGAMVWNFGGILIGPALFVVVYRLAGSFAVTFGLMGIVAAAGFACLVLCRAESRRAAAVAARA